MLHHQKIQKKDFDNNNKEKPISRSTEETTELKKKNVETRVLFCDRHFTCLMDVPKSCFFR